MNCEEFEAVGLGCDRETPAEGGLGGAVRRIGSTERAAIEHLNACARCAALEESWREARLELQALREATRDGGAPLRVEMRLRQEFWAKRRAMKARAAAVVVAWVLASAALLVVGMVWWNWHIAQENIPLQSVNIPAKSVAQANPSLAVPAGSETTANDSDNGQSDTASGPTLVAAKDAQEFTLLPGSMAQGTGDAAVVRVRLQRGALGTLGLPVNEERAGDWIQVDLFVGEDGQPQAVRLPR
jgi:hypothetical protein